MRRIYFRLQLRLEPGHCPNSSDVLVGWEGPRDPISTHSTYTRLRRRSRSFSTARSLQWRQRVDKPKRHLRGIHCPVIVRPYHESPRCV